ncbi:MAG: S-adenosylmethionine:tRNA ribosyltransferase-isomerase, partial [Eubacterium sp.]
MRVEDFDYELPEELIAQKPLKDRDSCRLMVLDRRTNTIEHRHFHDIIEYLNKGDCLVMNDSRVIPARLYGIKQPTGARVEFLLSKRVE